MLVVIAAELNGKKVGRRRMSIIDDASFVPVCPFINENVEKEALLSLMVSAGTTGSMDMAMFMTSHIPVDEINEEDLLPYIHTIVLLLKR